MASEKIRSHLRVNQADLLKIKKLLQKHYFINTPFQLGRLKKMGESISMLADKFFNAFKIKYRTNYRSDELFGLVTYIGKRQQLHVRGYKGGRIESEIEPLGQYIEHITKPPNWILFNGLWYSAHRSIEFLLERWDIEWKLQKGINGQKYPQHQWREFSNPKTHYNVIRTLFSSSSPFGKVGLEVLINYFGRFFNEMRNLPFSCLVKKSLRKTGFDSKRSCQDV